MRREYCHGTRAKYRQGCRCVECKEANTKYYGELKDRGSTEEQKEARAKRKEELALAKTRTTSEKAKNRHLKNIYGISLSDFESMKNRQKGLCAICGMKSDRVLRVDHCHISSKVRELLCHKCNSGLGMFREDYTLLTKAVEYLRYHEVRLVD